MNDGVIAATAEDTELQQDTFPRVPICWPALLESEREAALAKLEKWTNWLVRRYALDQRTVPSCWRQHGALVEELSALHTAWAKAYAVSSAPDQPLRWQGDFAAARRRLGEWVSTTGCRNGEHRG